MAFRPDARTMNGMDTYEKEAEIRLNPYGPARPPESQRPDDEPANWRERLSLLMAKLRGVFTGRRGS